MTKQSSKNLLAFIIIVTTVLSINYSAEAQCNSKHPCPPGYQCISGHCRYVSGCNCLVRPISAACAPVCSFLTNPTPVEEILSISAINSNAVSLQLAKTQNVSAKIYDAAGKLVKTIVDGKINDGAYQLTWSAIDVNGNSINAIDNFINLKVQNYAEAVRSAVIN